MEGNKEDLSLLYSPPSPSMIKEAYSSIFSTIGQTHFFTEDFLNVFRRLYMVVIDLYVYTSTLQSHDPVHSLSSIPVSPLSNNCTTVKQYLGMNCSTVSTDLNHGNSFINKVKHLLNLNYSLVTTLRNRFIISSYVFQVFLSRYYLIIIFRSIGGRQIQRVLLCLRLGKGFYNSFPRYFSNSSSHHRQMTSGCIYHPP